MLCETGEAKGICIIQISRSGTDLMTRLIQVISLRNACACNTNKLNAGNMISGRKYTLMRRNKLFSFASFAPIYFRFYLFLFKRSYNEMKIYHFSITFRLTIYQIH